MADNRKTEGLEDALLDGDAAKVIERLDRELGNAPKLRLDPDLLTPRDFKRARMMLGVDPYELISSDVTEDRLTLIIWCLKSRTDPDFTMAQAEDTPFGEFDMGDDSPPPIPGPAVNGGSPGSAAAQRSRKKPTGRGRGPSSASTSD